MRASEPLPLFHSWPLVESGVRFDLGLVWDGLLPATTAPQVGRWDYDLAARSLSWCPVVHDLFGVPRDAQPQRADAVARYQEPSRAAMERLRAHALRHRRGFTLDVEITPGGGLRRWIRVIAAARVEAGRVTGLHGYKIDIGAAYR